MNPDVISERVRANMEVALDRACRFLAACDNTHENRKRVAQSRLDCVQAGHTTLGDLTAAARHAVLDIAAASSERGNGTQGPKRG